MKIIDNLELQKDDKTYEAIFSPIGDEQVKEFRTFVNNNKKYLKFTDSEGIEHDIIASNSVEVYECTTINDSGIIVCEVPFEANLNKDDYYNLDIEVRNLKVSYADRDRYINLSVPLVLHSVTPIFNGASGKYSSADEMFCYYNEFSVPSSDIEPTVSNFTSITADISVRVNWSSKSDVKDLVDISVLASKYESSNGTAVRLPDFITPTLDTKIYLVRR